MLLIKLTINTSDRALVYRAMAYRAIGFEETQVVIFLYLEIEKYG